MRQKKGAVLACLMIFICFWWTGSAYLTWLYRLIDVFGAARADLLSEVAGYLFQAAGLGAFALLVRRRPDVANARALFPGVLAGEAVCILLSVLSKTALGVLGFGFAMNLLHGVVAGIYLSQLTVYVPQQRRGIVFGVAYGAGSIGSWLLSLPMGRSFLRSGFVLIAYGVLIALTLALHCLSRGDKCETRDIQPDFAKPYMWLLALVLLLLSLVKSLGFYYPMADVASGVSLEFSRVFYAIGLVAAGLLSDKNRKYGAICCLACLVCPFLTVALKGVPGSGTALWILSYVFSGFFVVWRVVMFCDIAAKRPDLLWLSGFGLMLGRMGDAAGAAIAIALNAQTVILLVLCFLLFVVTVAAFFVLYQKLYIPAAAKGRDEKELIKAFQTQYGLSSRESEVMCLLIAGHSNPEIAGELYISENTVKFHVKNVLKKTDCKNRTDLNLKFRQSGFEE